MSGPGVFCVLAYYSWGLLTLPGTPSGVLGFSAMRPYAHGAHAKVYMLRAEGQRQRRPAYDPHGAAAKLAHQRLRPSGSAVMSRRPVFHLPQRRQSDACVGTRRRAARERS